jgi:hypothetical protein
MAALATVGQHALQSLISSAAQDVIAVYDQATFRQVFQNARPLKVTVKPTSQIMDQPVETGSVITDQTIILPIEIELSLIIVSLFYRSEYQVLKQLRLNRTFLTVQTRADVFKNMIIADLPHEESPENYDSLTIALKLREIQIFTAISVPWTPKNPTYGSTVNRGNVQTMPITAQKRTALDKLLF